MTVVDLAARREPTRATLASVAAFLRGVSPFAGLVAHDVVADRQVLRRELPDLSLAQGAARQEPRALTDADAIAIAERLELAGLEGVRLETVSAAIALVARENPIDPLADALRSLQWDGVDRLSRWTARYLGASDTLHHRSAGRAWLTAAVARALRPGCKADAAIILEGRQGSGKSSAARILAGSEMYFTDALPSLESKDAHGHIVGKWIVELSELDNLRKSEVETIKRFLSATHIKYRPPYARYEVEIPRRCVFIGTTNRQEYLKDTSGNRRFWPIACGNIDLEALDQDRDQLLAEAVAAFRAGAAWWLRDDEAARAAVAAEARLEGDAWADRLEGDLLGRQTVSLEDVRLALGIDLGRFGTADQRRARACLEALGWVPGPKDPSTRRRLFVRSDRPKA